MLIKSLGRNYWTQSGKRFLHGSGNQSLIYTLNQNEKLSHQQRLQYEEDGFLLIKNLIPFNDLETYRKRFSDIANGKVKCPGLTIQKDISVAKQTASEQTVYKLQDLFLDEVLFQYCKQPQILEYVENFTGINIMAIHSMLINKPPDEGAKSSRHPLHQDLCYFPMRPADRIVCAWTALQDVFRENGCIVAVPGSHKGVLLEHDYPEWQGPVNKLYHGIKSMDTNASERVYLEMSPGDTILFHPLLIHGSGTNRTKNYRKAISCHYAASECNYVDMKGTPSEKLAQEIIQMAKDKYGTDLDYTTIWKFRSNVVQGERKNI